MLSYILKLFIKPKQPYEFPLYVWGIVGKESGKVVGLFRTEPLAKGRLAMISSNYSDKFEIQQFYVNDARFDDVAAYLNIIRNLNNE